MLPWRSGENSIQILRLIIVGATRLVVAALNIKPETFRLVKVLLALSNR